ncbi:MAG: transglycosylase SLT domain-containing protein [Limnobacter sp.]|nr:transglycosylase SLT domain-containing protein [Limnobacter sp.]
MKGKIKRTVGLNIAVGLTGLLLPQFDAGAEPIQQAALEPKAFTLQGLSSQTGLQTGFGIQLQAHPALVGVDLVSEAEDVWELIRRGFAIPDLFMKNIRPKERDLVRSTAHLTDLLKRSEPYIHYIASECEKRGLPTELALVPFVESRFNPHARSHAQAEGLWQIIPSTGKYFDLKQNQWVDQRRDLVASTRVALDYFTYLYDLFGDWQLALIAYNWGEGSVQKAIKAARAKGLQPNIANLDLPEETRYYVPKLQAIKNVIQNPKHFGISLPHLPNAPYFVEIRRKSNVNLKEVAKKSGVELDLIKALNPGLQQDTWHVAHNDTLLVPVQYEKQVKLSLGSTQDSTQNPTQNSTQNPTQNPTQNALGIPSAAFKATIAVSAVKAATPPAVVKAVQTAKLDKAPAREVVAKSTSKPTKTRSFKSYEVRQGESLKELATRFGMQKDELVALNGLSRKTLQPGMLISIPQ